MLKYFKRKGFMVIFTLVFVLALSGIVGCSAQNQTGNLEETAEQASLFAYVGANLKGPVSELAERYTAETGTEIELTFQNAGALLNQIEAMQKGDIYMPGGMPFVEKAMAQQHLGEVISPIAYHTPVIITPKDNPAGITSLQDLAKPGIKLIIPDKEATAIGKTAYRIFEKAGLKAEIENNIKANLETPAKVLIAISMGQGEAGIVEYSNTLNHQAELSVIEIDPNLNEVEEIPIAALVYSKHKALTEDFMHFVQQNGPAVFEAYGFKTAK